MCVRESMSEGERGRERGRTKESDGGAREGERDKEREGWGIRVLGEYMWEGGAGRR